MTVWQTEHALSTLENQCSVLWNVIGLPRKKSCLMPINHGKWISEVAKVNFKFKHHYFNIYGANRINAWIYPDHQGNKFRVNAVWKVQKKDYLHKNRSWTIPISQLNFTLIQSVISSVKITFLECQRCAIWSSITGIGDFTHISNAALALEPFWCGTLAVPWWLIKMVIISNVRK